MTLYEELGLQPNCTMDQIKLKYRILAGIHHPDKGGDEERFKRIKFAYEVLSDPERRRQYDESKTTDEPVDQHKEAISNLAEVFFAIIPNFDCLGGNLIEAMKNEINRVKAVAFKSLVENDKYISNLEVVKNKLKMKNPEKENIILSFIEAQLETRLRDKMLFEKRISISDLMLSILDDYQYGFIELINEVSVVMETETKTQ